MDTASFAELAWLSDASEMDGLQFSVVCEKLSVSEWGVWRLGYGSSQGC